MKGKLRTAGWSIVFLALSFLSLSWGTVEITPGKRWSIHGRQSLVLRAGVFLPM